jgi:hypothetical protein
VRRLCDAGGGGVGWVDAGVPPALLGVARYCTEEFDGGNMKEQLYFKSGVLALLVHPSSSYC